MAIAETKKQIRSIGYEGKLKRLNDLIDALSCMEDDLDALDCLAQIIQMSNEASRMLIIKRAQAEIRLKVDDLLCVDYNLLKRHRI